MAHNPPTISSEPLHVHSPERRSARLRFAEELANSITGGLGWVASVGGLAVLVAFATLYSNAAVITACSVYSATLILAYSATTLYHAMPWPGAKRVLQMLDHCTIYLLIAGTYTPFALGPLRGGWGWTLFGIVWGLALLGILFKAIFGPKFPIVSVLIYLGMGWLGVIAIIPILELVPGLGKLFLLIGGIAYTAGVGFYMTDHKLLFGHAIWHLFVLTGSSFHYFAILFWVVIWPK